jgi:bacterioferritin-associated ferredoxin
VYVCHCRVVTDRTIRATIEAGASTAAEVRRSCGAGSVCGGCYPAIRALVAAHATVAAEPKRAPGTAPLLSPCG